MYNTPKTIISVIRDMVIHRNARRFCCEMYVRVQFWLFDENNWVDGHTN